MINDIPIFDILPATITIMRALLFNIKLFQQRCWRN